GYSISFLSSHGYHPSLHSFPTRRSSDLYGFAGREKNIAPERFDYTARYQDLKKQLLNLSKNFNSAFFESIEPNFIEIHYNDQFRSEEHTSELQSRENLVCRLLLEKKKYN